MEMREWMQSDRKRVRVGAAERAVAHEQEAGVNGRGVDAAVTVDKVFQMGQARWVDTGTARESTARPGCLRARAWHGPTPCPCLGLTFSPWASTGTARKLVWPGCGPLILYRWMSIDEPQPLDTYIKASLSPKP
jgi:hypothetical protein